MQYSTRSAVLVFVILMLATQTAAGQIISSAADNDMHPNFATDGWVNVVGSYDVVPMSGFAAHVWLTPPDGNTYGGGVQFGGVPGIPEAIEKNITGLTNGVAYAIEWYIMSDTATGSGTLDVWFDVSFCGAAAETMHIPFTRRREWIREVQVFTANSTSCLLRFTARNPTGNGSNWIFLDSVQVAVASSTDFAIAVTGPAGVLAGTSDNVSVTIRHNGPDPGTAPVVTYPLPAGASVNGGAAGSVAVTGVDGANWSCAANAATPQTIECTRLSAMTLGSTSTFAMSIDFDPVPGATLISTLTVAPTFQAGNADPNPTNDTATFSSLVPICGNAMVEAGETCEDGNLDAGDGCDASCNGEPGFTCPTVGAACVPICGDGLVVLGEACDDDNAIVDDGCTVCVVDDGWLCSGAPSVCGAEACGDGIRAGDEACDDGDAEDGDGCSALCVVEPDFTCGGSPSVCVPGICGDGDIATVEGCDDGNMADDDGCSARCVEEPGFTCTGEPSTCSTTCGDGIVRGDERCDDGDIESGDGCNASCTIESGWSCADEPSVCEMTCGNGDVDAGEACDDGNLEPGDGCDASCRIETMPPEQCDGGPCPTVTGHVVGGPFCAITTKRTSDGPWLLAVMAALGLVRLRRRAR